MEKASFSVLVLVINNQRLMVRRIKNARIGVGTWLSCCRFPRYWHAVLRYPSAMSMLSAALSAALSANGKLGDADFPGWLAGACKGDFTAIGPCGPAITGAVDIDVKPLGARAVIVFDIDGEIAVSANAVRAIHA